MRGEFDAGASGGCGRARVVVRFVWRVYSNFQSHAATRTSWGPCWRHVGGAELPTSYSLWCAALEVGACLKPPRRVREKVQWFPACPTVYLGRSSSCQVHEVRPNGHKNGVRVVCGGPRVVPPSTGEWNGLWGCEWAVAAKRRGREGAQPWMFNSVGHVARDPPALPRVC